MWKLVVLLVVVVAVAVFGFNLIHATADNGTISANTVLPATEGDISGFVRAIAPWEWSFPRDHGPHPNFQTEWWYYTGNLAVADGRRFGYQFTIFRRALTPQEDDSGSEWRTNQIYLAHFTVADIEAGRFYHQERYSRGSADLAGAHIDPRFHVWVENWQIAAQDDDTRMLRLEADAGEMAVDFTLDELKAPVLQGDEGLSVKGSEPGNAGYYYSVPRYATRGTITTEGQSYEISGSTWMDHEFNTQALDADALGWDWFGLQLDDNRELMVGHIRLRSGSERSYGALLVEADGSTESLSYDEFSIETTGTWTSPHTGVTYPAGWNISIAGDDPLNLTLTPLMSDQELQATVTTYWEGAVRITGDATGYGYAELTGYRDELASRF